MLRGENEVTVFMRVKPQFKKYYNNQISVIEKVSYNEYLFTRDALLDPNINTEYRQLMITEIQLIKSKCAQ